MSASRQARRERRAAERKARKLERKLLRSGPTAARQDEAVLLSGPKTQKFGFVSQTKPGQPAPAASGFVSQMRLDEPAFFSEVKSQSRHAINRANAQLSTGPRTLEGKLASSRNSLKHGLASGTLFIPGEDPAEFEALRNALFEEHQPATPTEELLVDDMVRSYWLTQRAIRLQNDCFSENGGDHERTGRLVPVVRVDHARLSLFLRYQTTHDRAFYKALHTLTRLQKERLQADPAQSRFLPQNRPTSDPPLGFVSQNSPDLPTNGGFVSQNPAASPPHRPPPPLPNPKNMPHKPFAFQQPSTGTPTARPIVRVVGS